MSNWKNEQLVTLLPGHSVPVHLSAHNFTNTKRQIVLEAYPGVIPRNFAQRFGNPEMWRMELLDPMIPLPVAIHVDSKSVRSKSITGRHLAHLGRTAEMSCLGPPQARVTQSFRPGEVRNVTITVTLPPSAKLGEIYVMRIVQRVGEVVAGGYTLYVTCADTNRQ